MDSAHFPQRMVPLRVFISEDSPVVRERLSSYLATTVSDIEIVGTADDATTTLQRLQTLRPDVAILDLWLREQNSIDIISTIRAAAPRLFLIVLTNDASARLREKCLGLGADRFFDKSHEFDLARDLVSELAAANAQNFPRQTQAAA